MQKLMEVCTEEQRMRISLMFTEDPSELVRISLDTHGTRSVQKLIEILKTRQQIALVVSALKLGFIDLIKDLNGNHVVQKCLQSFSKEDNKNVYYDGENGENGVEVIMKVGARRMRIWTRMGLKMRLNMKMKMKKERLKEGEAADEEMKKLKKEVKKKGAASTKEAVGAKAATTKKKASGSDEEHHSSSGGSQAGDNEVTGDDDNDDVQWQTDTSLEAARQCIQEQLSAVTAEMVMLSTDEPNSEPEKKPKQEKKDVSRNGTEKVAEKPSTHARLVAEIKDHLKKGPAAAELGSYLASLPGTRQEVMDAFIESLFEGVGKGFSKEVGKKKNYLAAAAKDEGSQILLLRAVEVFCVKSGGDAVKEVALVAKSLYDADILEEEYIVQWYEEGLAGPSKSSLIWKNLKPLVEWLQSAETESEEE